MTPIILVGSNGKMTKTLQSLLTEQKIPFKIFSREAPKSLRVETFKNSRGVIDFSLPTATAEVGELALEAQVPWICGTTGFESKEAARKIFVRAAKKIPIVFDSNFSLGVEVFCRAAEIFSKSLSCELSLTDIHHSQKRDAPSGTALKILERMKSENEKARIKIDSIRVGEVFGEHRLLASFDDQTLELVHRANSRKPFASGALNALLWAHHQKPGLYSMTDVIARPVKKNRKDPLS